MSNLLTVAVVQTGSYLFDTARSLEVLESKVREAAAGGAKLVVFPEAFLGGYPKGNHFGAPVGSRTQEGRDLYRRYFESAIEIPGDETIQIEKWCRELDVDLVVGVVERSTNEPACGTLFCTALTFSAADGLVGKRRKLMPTAAERVVWGMGDGSTLDVAETSSGKIATVICWENYMPALRISQYSQGAELYCAPTVDDRESWTSLMRTIAMEGRCFVLSANQYMTRLHVPQGFETVQGSSPDTVLINGGSVIVSPLGEILAGPHFGSETTLFAQVDKREIARGKMDFDATGHYSRPDVFQLRIDRDKKTPVSFD